MSQLFNKKDYQILNELIINKCVNSMCSLTIEQLMGLTGFSATKVRTVVKSFLILDYIKEGSKDGNCKTYYITEEGVEHYKVQHGLTDQDIQEMIEEEDI